MEAALKVDQPVALLAQGYIPDFYQIDQVAADGLYLANLALETRQRAFQHRLAQRAFLPAAEAETVVHRHPGHTGEVARHLLLLVVQHVDA